jgi:hypothetical protein
MKTLGLFTIITAWIILITGCTAPVKYENTPLKVYDKNTKYTIEPSKNGYYTIIDYTRYQFIPESDSVATACKSQLTAIAWEYADKQGKDIKHINEQRIQISLGRNELSGITSCKAKVFVKWK